MGDNTNNGWFPIETAPKDGTKIDLWITGINKLTDEKIARRHTDCRWNVDRWFSCPKFPTHLTPTHWRPMPLPPGKSNA